MDWETGWVTQKCSALLYSSSYIEASTLLIIIIIIIILTCLTCLRKEEDTGVRWISVLTNVADQLYYPCEHIAWAADAELIKVKSDKWWLLSTVLWGTSLLLGILRWGLPVHKY